MCFSPNGIGLRILCTKVDGEEMRGRSVEAVVQQRDTPAVASTRYSDFKMRCVVPTRVNFLN